MRSRTDPAGASRARLAVLVASGLAALFLAGTLAAPALEGVGSRWGTALRMVYAPVCHQNADRSVALAGGPLAVCARCTGLYAGGVLGLVAATLWLAGTGKTPRPLWLAVAVAPTALDALLPWIGVRGFSNVPRLLLAVPAGGVAALFLAAGIADWFASEPRTRQRFADPVSTSRALEEVDG